MRNIFKLYLRDIRNIFSNYAALIVFIALCILPSLYAWFNIKASWDPYSQNATSQIKIGVVNKDKGTDLNGKYINIGDKVIEELKDNKQMGWQFVSEEEAYKNVEEGDYYAKLTIPDNFSENLTSILGVDIKKGEIEYTVNEIINAIAPKLTDKGATGVQENVSKALVETVGKAIFSVANEAGITLENQLPRISNIYNALLQVQSHFSDINSVVDMADEGATKTKDLVSKVQGDIPLLEETIKNAEDLTSELENFLKTSKNSLNKFAPSLKQDIKFVGEISRDIEKTSKGLINAINANSEKIPEIIDNLLVKANSLSDMNKSLIRALEAINKFKGTYNQVPPMYSALKKNGVRLYELARKGIEVEREGRPITIYDIKDIEINLPYISMEVTCSKGTYIRSLCYDIGEALKVGACMTELRRTETSCFHERDSINIKDLTSENIHNYIISIEDALKSYPKLKVNEGFSKLLINGVRVMDRRLTNEKIDNNILYRVYDENDKFLGLGKRELNGFKIEKLLI